MTNPTSASPRQGPEVICDAIVKLLEDNIEASLVSIRNDRQDAHVRTPVPVKYYLSSAFNPNFLPAVWVVADREDFQLEMKNANHLNYNLKVNISLVCEAKDAEEATRAVYRYKSAMHMVLNQATIVPTDGLYKCTVTVDASRYSPLFTSDQTKNLFRKEVVLDCSVLCYESY